MATESELLDCIEACRTCGIFFLTTSNFLRHIFKIEDPEMNLIRMELLAWKVEINENDGFPQHICSGCIHDFQKIFKFRRSCVDIQQQFHHFFKLRHENMIKVKTELPDPEEEENNCDFVYVDDLSDDEYDPSSVTPFNIPHVPIKDEIIEEATVPMETAATTSIKPPPLAVVNNNGVEIPMEDSSTEQTGKEDLPPEEDAATKKEASMHSSFDTTSESSNSLKCNLCLHISPNEQEHRQHMQRLHEVRDLECHICGKKFHNSTAIRLKFHMKWHKLSKHIKCAQCGFYCSSRDTLNEHKRSLHAKVECEVCGKSILSKRMKSHMQQHQSQTKWPCSYCQDVFNSDAEHEQHIWMVHAAEDNAEPEKVEDIPLSSICAHCPETFANRNDLEIHVLQQHPHPHPSNQNRMPESSNYDAQSVQQSGSHSSSIDERQVQLHRHQNQSTENIFNNDSASTAGTQSSQESSSTMETSCQESSSQSCPTENVDSDFANSGASESEAPPSESPSIRDDDQMMFVCAQCTETFSSIEKLCAHHKEHLKKAAFSCQVCGKNFDLKFSLNRHLKKHKRNAFN